MNSEIITGITNNVILLLGLGIIYSLLPTPETKNKKLKITLPQVYVGLSLSLIVILVMLSSFQLTEGVTLDTRSVFISMTTVFFGFLPGLMVIISASIVRIIQGGVGVFPGVLVIISSGIIGILYRNFRFDKIKDRKKYRLIEIFIFGVIVHIVMLILFLFLPKDIRIEIIQNIYGYVLTIYPIATVFFAWFMFKRYDWIKNTRLLSETEENFSKAVKSAPVPIILHAEDGEVLSISQAWSDISGYSHDDIPTLNDWTHLAYGEKQQEVSDFINTLYHLEGNYHDGEFQIKHKEGNTILWDFHSTYIGKLPDGRRMAMSVALDVTKRAELVNELTSEKKFIETTLLSVGDGVIVTDAKGDITVINQVAETLTGWNKDEAIGTSIEQVFNIVSAETGKKCENIVHKVVELGVSQELANHTNLVSKDGTIRPIADSAAPIIKANNEIAGVIVVFRDYTEKYNEAKKLKIAAYNDYLTGLYNRRYYEEKLPELDVEENYPLTIVMADINGLKLINDAFGHTVGDELLVSAGKLISENCRKTDLIARIGGDEFVIVMPKTDDKTVERIISVINKKAELIKTKSIPLSISFGNRSKKHKEESIHDIFQSAEDLMYREKLLKIPSMRSGAIETILNTLYEKDAKSEVHSRVVSQLSENIARVYGMDRQDIAEVKTAGLLHDIGKIIIPSEIINKDGKLTKEEYETMKSHSEIGFRILNSTQNMRSISNIVLNHHERWDGCGYPLGIKSKEIPIKSRIITIADAFDAMVSERSYRDIISKEDALKEIVKCAGTQFDPDLVNIFKKHFKEITDY